MGPASAALAKVPNGTTNVVAGKTSTDTIYAEKIQSASDGRYRMVVYMSGMDALALGALIPGTLNPNQPKDIETLFNSNLPTLLNNTGILRTDVQDYINSAYKKFNTTSAPVAEIQLVGHSNGGQQMQAYASAGTYRGMVTSLVVFGSPLIKRTDELGDKSQKDWQTKIKAVAFRNWNDPIPWASDAVRVVGTGVQGVQALLKKDPGALANLILKGGDVVVWDKNGKAQFGFSSENLALNFKYHNAGNPPSRTQAPDYNSGGYRQYAAQFDAANSFPDQRAAMQRFVGTVVDKTDPKKVDGFSPPVILIPGL